MENVSMSYTHLLCYLSADTFMHGSTPDSFVICAVIYSYYVMIGRLCAPMLQRRSDARGSVGQGGKHHIFWLHVIAQATI